MTLRSLLGPESADQPQGSSAIPALESLPDGESWHQSDRGDLTIILLPPETGTCGGLEVSIPSGERLRLLFGTNGILRWNAQEGRWHLGNDGLLELELRADGRTVREQIWFSKPNLRLRCTLEEWSDGRPGRASFSSEIRRMNRSPQPVNVD